ncbi:MAG TPA: (2Fe-2S)-binding protein [Rhodanobacteraceae bacterium]|nr:(2Fe-2S)-binding protein [Rhodanobacteraceae bacterium]
MSARVEISINGRRLHVPEGISVAAAIARAGQPFRRSLRGEPRAPCCGMGVCFECRVGIDGRPHQRACMVNVCDGMRIDTDG